MADNYWEVAQWIITVLKNKNLDFSKLYQSILEELLKNKDIAGLKKTLKAVEFFLEEKESVLKSLKVVNLFYNNLADSDLSEIKNKIIAKYGSNCVINDIEDKNLIGGFKIEIDSDLCDNSLLEKLHKINVSLV